jgi:hypothetical protein
MLACTVTGGPPEPRPRRERSAVFPPVGHTPPWPRTCGEPVVGPLYPEERSLLNPQRSGQLSTPLVIEAAFPV